MHFKILYAFVDLIKKVHLFRGEDMKKFGDFSDLQMSKVNLYFLSLRVQTKKHSVSSWFWSGQVMAVSDSLTLKGTRLRLNPSLG